MINSIFTPKSWPEVNMLASEKRYEECEVCTPKSRIIWGEGNPKASIHLRNQALDCAM